MASRDELIQLVAQYADYYGVRREVAIAQIKRESANFRPDVVYGPFVGSAGERGMSQFTPAAWSDWGQGPQENAYDPDAAMNAWGAYMVWLLSLYSGDYTKALQGYNGGPGNVDRGTVSAMARRYASEILAAVGSPSNPGESQDPVITFPDSVDLGSILNGSSGISPALLLGGGLLLVYLVTR